VWYGGDDDWSLYDIWGYAAHRFVLVAVALLPSLCKGGVDNGGETIFHRAVACKLQ
jgi:hypothetical protein